MSGWMRKRTEHASYVPRRRRLPGRKAVAPPSGGCPAVRRLPEKWGEHRAHGAAAILHVEITNHVQVVPTPLLGRGAHIQTPTRSVD